MKTSGFNFQDLEEENKKIDSFLDINGDSNMKEDKPKKKKVKFNFDNLFPAPKNNKSMGMDNVYDGEPFEGLL